MAGTALVEYLRPKLGETVEWGDLGDAKPATVTVLLASHEAPETVPRSLAQLRGSGTRVVFVYDGSLPHEELIEAASGFGLWSLCDVREDIVVLTDQVQRALVGRVWERDRMAEQWSRRLAQNTQRLSNREVQVAQAFCGVEALDPKEIAEQLGLSVNTVRVHLANIRRKLGGRYTGNRDAMRAALLDRGWLH